MHGAQGPCSHCGHTARLGARWHALHPAGTRRAHHPALAIGLAPRALAAVGHPPCLPRRRKAAPHGPSGRPECSGLRPSLRPTSTDNQLVSTILHSVRTRTTIIYPERPFPLLVIPGPLQVAPSCSGLPWHERARSCPFIVHERPPRTTNVATDGNHASAATLDRPRPSMHAYPCTPPAPSARAAPRAAPRTRKGPPPCGSGPYCVMPRAGVSPARFRAGAPPARQGR